MKKLIVLLILCMAVPAFAVKLIPNGSTSQSISVVILDADGEPNTSPTVTDFDLYYQIDGPGAQSTKIDCTALASADAAWTSGGAFHKGNGLVRIDIPDANLSDGAGAMGTFAVVDAATSNKTSFYEIQLTDAVQFTGLTTLVGRVTETFSALVDNIQLAMDANSTKLAFLTETLDLSTLTDNIQAAMDANSLLVNWTSGRAAILTDLAGISQIGDKVRADMDANSTKLAFLIEEINLSTLTDNIVLAIDANSTSVVSPLNTTVASATSASQITLTAGATVAGAYEYCIVTIKDDTDSHYEQRVCTNYTAGRVMTLNAALKFTPVAGDDVRISFGSYYKPIKGPRQGVIR